MGMFTKENDSIWVDVSCVFVVFQRPIQWELEMVLVAARAGRWDSRSKIDMKRKEESLGGEGRLYSFRASR